MDLEASGLHRGSYPVEVGWVSHDLAEGGSLLIRPAAEWGEELWSHEAERVHGLSRRDLLERGLAPAAAAAALNAAVGGGDVLVDSPECDGRWLAALFAEAGVTPSFELPRPPPDWRDTVATQLWREAKSCFDSDALVAVAATRAGLSPEEHEAAWAALKAASGLVPHRALDDAVGNALGLAAVAVLEAALEQGEAAAAALSTALAARAAALVRDRGRGPRDAAAPAPR